MLQVEPPDYFEAIRQEAAARWEKLEADPESAAVWRLLFRQVQSPRHVVSELLQNADDAGATEAWVWIDDSGCFVFEHNGKDFTEEQFRSLCRFGYSNKRSLFTIGFRGIGFKSTFSLGSPVSVQTPFVSVAFHEQRFTEPLWISSDPPSSGRTRISVQITDEHRRAEIEKNFQDWIDSPLSLLFFRHIRCIHVAGEALRWHGEGQGPVGNSEWIVFEGSESERLLIVRSAPEPFPADALDEIRRERMAPSGEEPDFPPCTIDMVLGEEGRLFVVLPTGGDTGLPFSANAPFMLTPDREHIKSPAISPVNRWLLERMGRLAASAMIDWLGNEGLPIEERALAYEWMPADITADDSPDKRNGDSVGVSFQSSIANKPVLLTDDGRILEAGSVIELPLVALETWSSDQASKLLDDEDRPPLCRHIATRHRQKLRKRSLVKRVEDKDFLAIISIKRPLRPKGWQELHALWSFVSSYYAPGRQLHGLPPQTSLCILPVHGSMVLHHASETMRVTAKPEQCRLEDDWKFLTERLTVVDAEWIRFISERDRAAVDKLALKPDGPQDPAAKLLKLLNLDQATGSHKMINRVAKALLDESDTESSAWVRLAHIAAALGATAGEHFRFVTRDGKIRGAEESILHDIDGSLEEVLPADYADAHLLNPSYLERLDSCTLAEWNKWLEGDGSGLSNLPEIIGTMERFETWREFEARMFKLQSVEQIYYKYSTARNYTYQYYRFTDFDFPSELIDHWTCLPKEIGVWALIAKRLLMGDKARWQSRAKVIGQETATSGVSLRNVGGVHCDAAWLRRLRAAECLPDRHGIPSLPTDLLRRTPETEGLLEVEPFVDARLDNEHTRDLLDSLGVTSKPRGPERLLGCLKALTLATPPPLMEIEKWYRRLDQFTANCSELDLAIIAAAFTKDELMISQDGDWLAPSAIFLDADEADAPGVPLVLAAVKDLRLWVRLNVEARPTVDSAINWLKQLPAGKLAEKLAFQRVEAMLKRHPLRIWNEVGLWLDLSGRWTAVAGLDHALDSRQRVAFSHLHEWVKQRVADLRLLPAETVASEPFSSLIPLEKAVANRILTDSGAATDMEELPWLHAFGSALLRVNLEDEEKTAEARVAGKRFIEIRLRVSPSIQVTPYFEGKPAGTAKNQEIAWIGQTVFTVALSSARLARLLPEQLGRSLPTDSLREALCYCYERPVQDVVRYMEENFDTEANSEEPGQEDLAPAASGNGDEPQANPDIPAPHSEPEQTPDTPNGDSEPALPDPPGQPDPDPTPPKPRKPTGPGLMERFAFTRGFISNGSGFVHPDGSSIIKDSEDGFSWRFQDARSGSTRHLRAFDACLEKDSLEISHEAWAAIERAPDLHGLVLLDSQGRPVEHSGADLCRMKQDGVVRIYPATYLLKHQNA